MAREDIYIAQLQELGVWNEAFRPMVKDLAKAERRRTRAEKEWAATVPKGGKPSFTHPLYQACVQLDRTVMEYREELGLTPKALRRVRGIDAPAVASGDAPDGIAKRLDAILARAEECDAVDVSTVVLPLSVTAAGGGDSSPLGGSQESAGGGLSDGGGGDG